MKVAIWGSLNHGNFGDEIMSIMIGLKLKSLGYDVYIYRLDKCQAQRYNLRTVFTLEDLLSKAEFSIIGGGSWLESRPLGLEYEKDFEAYLLNIEKFQIPFYTISIGGDTNNDYRRLTVDRFRLFSSQYYQGGTVRLESDLEILKFFNKEIEYYPDIVLLSDQFFLHKEKIKREKTKIAISVTNNKKLKFFDLFLKYVPFLYRNYEIYYIRTHLPQYNYTYEYHTSIRCKKITNIDYTNLEDFFSTLNDMDFVISSKLHPGIAALACKTPFIWISGNDKVRAFFNSIGRKNYEYSIGQVVRSILKKKSYNYTYNYDFTEIEKQRNLATGHLKYLEKLNDKYQNRHKTLK